MQDSKDEPKYLVPLTGVFVACLVLVPPLASKFINVAGFTLSGATLVFPIVFIFNDILTEVYGYARSRQVIWTGMLCQLLSNLFYWLVGIWSPAFFWKNQVAYDTILGTTLRVTAASLIAYFCSEFVNSLIVSKMKFFVSGKRGLKQAYRYIASTAAGQFFDSVLFMGIGFLGVLDTKNVINTALTIWVAKTLYEIIALPFSMTFANWLKRVENIDMIDRPGKVSYNPFRFATKS